MTKRLGCLVFLLGAGCIFTPRPMIPLEESDAGDTSQANSGADAATGAVADASAGYFGDSAAPNPDDSNCHRAGDAGYTDEGSAPCDPMASRDGGSDAGDADCGAADDGGDGGGCVDDRPRTDATPDAAAGAIDR